MALTAQQKRELKARAHHLKPVLQTGNAGLSDAVLAEAELALAHHELIKLKLAGVDREKRAALCDALVLRLQAEIVSQIGGVIVLYRQRPETAKPAAKKTSRPANKPAAKRRPVAAAKSPRR